MRKHTSTERSRQLREAHYAANEKPLQLWVKRDSDEEARLRAYHAKLVKARGGK